MSGRMPEEMEQSIRSDEDKNLLEDYMRYSNATHQTGVILACAHNSVNVLAALLEENADVDQTDVSGYSALHYAVANNNFQCVKMLLTREDINLTATTNVEGKTVLHLAVENGCSDVVRTLLAKDLARYPFDMADSLRDITSLDGLTPLQLACVYGNVDVIYEFLHQSHLQMDELLCDRSGDSLLHFAIRGSIRHNRNSKGFVLAPEPRESRVPLVKLFLEHYKILMALPCWQNQSSLVTTKLASSLKQTFLTVLISIFLCRRPHFTSLQGTTGL